MIYLMYKFLAMKAQSKKLNNKIFKIILSKTNTNYNKSNHIILLLITGIYFDKFSKFFILFT